MDKLSSQGKKTILCVENGVGFGGAVFSLRTYLEHADHDRNTFVLVHSLQDQKFESFQPLAKTVYVPKFAPANELLARFVSRFDLDVLVYALRLMRVAHRERADMLYLNNDILLNSAGVLAGKWLGLPMVLHERNIPQPVSRMINITGPMISRYLAISGPVKQALNRLGVPDEKIRMVPEGLDLTRYQLVDANALETVRASMGVQASAKLVVLVGMVMEWKGQHVMLSAARSVLERYPDTRFAIVGECPPESEGYLGRLEAQVRENNLAHRVSFIGYRSDVPAVMQAADIVLHTSILPEPFGRVIIEAMAVGRPVIATAIGAPPEIVQEGETGFLVPPADAGALANKICFLLGDDELRREVGERAREEVFNKYSIQRHASLIQAVFDEMSPANCRDSQSPSP